MSTTPKKKTSLDDWEFSSAPTVVRSPSQPPPPQRSSRPPSQPLRTGQPEDLQVVSHRGRPSAHDTLLASKPYAFQSTNAAAQLASLLDNSATIVNPQAASRGVHPNAAAQMAGLLQGTGTIVMPQGAAQAPSVAPSAPVGAAPAPTTDHAPAVDDRGTGKKPFFDVMKVNKLVVSSYKFMGFAVLGTILLGLASFIATNLFYMLNESWVTPLQLSSTDPRVLQLTAQYSAAKAARDGVATQKLEFTSRLSDAERIIASEGKFQGAFDEAMKADRSGQLDQFRKLINNIQRTRREVSSVNRAYTAMSKDQLQQEYAAGLIDKDAKVKGGYELAEIQGANLGLHEKNVEIDARVTDLQRQVASLQTAGTHGEGAMSYEILHMKHEYEQSVLASQKATDDASALSKSIAMFDKTLTDYDAQLARIEKAPYVQAADKSVSTAFVPYDNIGAAQVGDTVYKCAVSFLFCSKIGKIAEVLDGEIIGKHPLHNRDMRGILVRLELTDPKAIEKPVLHLHRAPLGL